MKKPLRCYLGWHYWKMREGHVSHQQHPMVVPLRPDIWRWYKFIIYCPLCRKVKTSHYLAYDENGCSIDEINFRACGVTPPETLEEWVAGTTVLPR